MSLEVEALHGSGPKLRFPIPIPVSERTAGQLWVLGDSDTAPQPLASSLMGMMNVNKTAQEDKRPESFRRD